MSSESGSSVEKRPERGRSRSEENKSNKLFITNLDGNIDPKELQSELRRLFEKCGIVQSIVAKRNRNTEYCFAFAELKDHATAAECIKNFDQSTLGGKQIKVEFQDDAKRRKDSNKGCYTCGKMGHFARQCRSARNQSSRDYRRRSRSKERRSRSKSDDRDRRRKTRRRERSDSSERNYSRSPKAKKERRNKSKERDGKKKKHKKSYSSDS